MQHCVGEYPTLPKNMNLNQLDYLRNRHPNVRFGFSTHEDPDDTNLIQIAIAKGAVSFEKHVGLPTSDWPLNAYSGNLAQTRKWLDAAERAIIACGPAGQRYLPPKRKLRVSVHCNGGFLLDHASRKAQCLHKKILSSLFRRRKHKLRLQISLNTTRFMQSWTLKSTQQFSTT